MTRFDKFSFSADASEDSIVPTKTESILRYAPSGPNRSQPVNSLIYKSGGGMPERSRSSIRSDYGISLNDILLFFITEDVRTRMQHDSVK